MMKMSGKAFGVLTVILVLVIIFCIKGTVMSRENDERERTNRHYAVLEQEYRDRAQQLLEEQGFRNCGVNIRWVDEGDGNREYTVLLHHRNLNGMAEEDKSVLTDLLTEMEFHDEACSFSYVIGSL